MPTRWQPSSNGGSEHASPELSSVTGRLYVEAPITAFVWTLSIMELLMRKRSMILHSSVVDI
jgi:hypothetical protein